jgi:hypothetical protein
MATKFETCVTIDDPNEYTNFEKSIETFENNSHYSSIMCMKNTKYGPNHDNTKDVFMASVKKMSGRTGLKVKCVLPLGHVGKCCHKFSTLFKPNSFTKKLLSSVDTAIYSTPGNDDYVYKNRSSRLYENVISSIQEKSIRDKKEKKKCAIPLKDASSPILLAQAYLDWMTFIVNIADVGEHLNVVEDENKSILLMLTKNKEHLISVYASSNRYIFDEQGNSICVITRSAIKLADVSDPTRDNRVNICDKDIQLGHNPRTEKYVSIRGENLLPMSRRGNLVIGERVFTENVWIEELKSIVNPY